MGRPTSAMRICWIAMSSTARSPVPSSTRPSAIPARSISFEDAKMSPTAIQDLPFVVVGGGIGGIATALALSRKGLPVHILEQADDLREIGAGIQMPPNAFRAFEALGVLRDVQDVA